MVTLRNRMAVLLTAALAGSAWCINTQAAVPYAEDLSVCKLPNGLVVLPVPGTQEAAHGDLLKLSSGAFSSYAVMENGRPLTPAQILGKLRSDKAADLQYQPDNQGTLWAISGRISELGAMYLSDAAARKLEAPMEIPSTSRNPAGMFPEIGEGRVYLVQTVDDHFALVRVLEKSTSGLVVQYVYDMTGTMKFDVPKAEPVDYRRPRPQAVTTAPANVTAPAAVVEQAAPTPAATEPAAAAIPPRPPTVLPPPASRPALGPNDHIAPGVIVLRGSGNTSNSSPTSSGSALEPSMDTFIRQREQMIQRRVAIIQLTAHTPGEMEKKMQAILDLASLHAESAADLLAAQIAFLNTRPTKEFSPDELHPCYAALKALGKPATAAALKGLKMLDLETPGDGIDSAMYRAGLLGRVIRAVEGDDVGNFILRREMDAETDAKRRAVFEFLLNKN